MCAYLCGSVSLCERRCITEVTLIRVASPGDQFNVEALSDCNVPVNADAKERLVD